MLTSRSSGIGGKPDNPVAYFTVEDDWDEVEISLDVCPVGQVSSQYQYGIFVRFMCMIAVATFDTLLTFLWGCTSMK